MFNTKSGMSRGLNERRQGARCDNREAGKEVDEKKEKEKEEGELAWDI